VELAEQRLANLRNIAATLPKKEEILKQVAVDLERREQGLIRAETGAQAQAQLVSILTRLGNEENPPVEIRATELGAISALPGGAYGAAHVTVQFQCGIAQLINFLAALSAQPELISTRDVQISSSNAKQKTIRVRLTVAGVVPRTLVPDKKGASLF
jgi:hypothetical protein